MTIASICKTREIAELVHFTTSTGLLGILSTQSILPRSSLENEQTLEYILKPNAPFRTDTKWVNYINLSISRINIQFFERSETWHKNDGLFWVILGIDPETILADGVHFTTTNNIYPSCIRGTGPEALERMFSQKVLGRYNAELERPATHPDNWTTCPQAEVLYPGRLSASHIRNIYVRSDYERNAVFAQIAALGIDSYAISVAPERFEF